MIEFKSFKINHLETIFQDMENHFLKWKKYAAARAGRCRNVK